MIVTRFPPSPTGHLHIGGARTALFNWLLARHSGGRFLLRIEDTDSERSRQEYTDSILDSMRWLGLDWDGEPVYQSRRFDVYSGYVDQLLASGHAYWCSCSPEEVEAMREKARAAGGNPRYDGRCRELGLGQGSGRAVRLKAPLAGCVAFDDIVKGGISVDATELDDRVLRRSDGAATYNLAVVVDDLTSGVTHVVRGDDHVANTPQQILISRALGEKLPRFGHVPMILGPDKKRLSKRHGARAVIEYEHDGLLPQALVNYLVRLGWSHGDQEIFSPQELVNLFSIDHVSRSPAAFDPAKLQWLNAHYMRAEPPKKLAALLAPFVEKILGSAPAPPRLEALAPLYVERASTLDELAQAMLPLLQSAAELGRDPDFMRKALTPAGIQHLKALEALIREAECFDAPALDALLHGYVEANGLKFGAVGPALRAALTGLSGGPGLPDIMAFLGRGEVLARIEHYV
jgi:glutamyl-tRNA synthetase